MNIITTSRLPQTSTYQAASQAAPAATEDHSKAPSDSFSFGESSDLAMAGMGAASGIIGIGAPAALVMGSAKAFISGRPLAGVGLAVAGVAAGGTLGVAALMGAAMSSDAGSSVGFNSYLAAGAATSVAAGLAIF